MSEKDTLVVYKQGALYGSLSSKGSGPGGRRVIYCVHGRPSAGCCSVLEKEIDQKGDVTSSRPLYEKETTSLLPPDHCHRTRNEAIDKKARRKLLIASVLCVVFMIGEIIGGYLSSSLAIATDAAHLLTDFASFMISLFSLWVSSRPATRKMSFGWYRAEVIGALTSVLMIWVVTGILVYLAVERVIYKDFEIDATIMLITSAVGVLVNLVMGLTLHQHGHSHGGGSHSHEHSHSNASDNNTVGLTKETTDQNNLSSAEQGLANNDSHGHKHSLNENKKSNINVRAAYIHVIGDFIQSFGVLIAAVVIYYKPEWNIVDPICTFLFSLLVLATTFAIMKDTLTVLMEGLPKGIDFAEVMNTFLHIDGVVKVHNLRIWALSLDKIALSAHLAIRPGVNPQNVLKIASKQIHEKYDFFEMTLQIEEFEEHMEDCYQCKIPSA